MILKIKKILLWFWLIPAIIFAGWSIQPSGTNSNLEDVDFVDVNHGWVVGGARDLNPNDAVILKTEDGGNTWNNVTPTYLNLGIDLFKRVSSPDSLICYATAQDTVGSGSHFYILKTTDGGNTWTVLPAPTYTLPTSIYFINSDMGWTAGELDYSPMVLHTSDGGNSWTVQGWYNYNGGPTRIFFCNSQQGFVAGGTEDSPTTRGYIMTTTDGGNSWFESYIWEAIIPYTWPLMTGVHFIDNLNGWACGNLYGATGPHYEERIVSTTDGGLNWDEVQIITDTTVGRLYDIHMVNSQTGWIVCGGDILHTTNGWVSWHFDTSNVTTTLKAVDFVDINNGWAAGYGGIILKYTGNESVAENLDAHFIKGQEIELTVMPATNNSLPCIISSPNSGTINFSLYNILAQKISSAGMEVHSGTQKYILQLPQDLPPGVYFLCAKTNNQSVTKKFVMIR
uniref:T9SS type A sorting domain-containing protein n=1 Tax=candidate division WOR-3 bacterium TaxID=2052148 RepID=A0A7V3VU03_UNCW3